MASADNVRGAVGQSFIGFSKIDDNLKSSQNQEDESLLDATRITRREIIAIKSKSAKSSGSNSVQKALDRFGSRLEDAIKKSPAGKFKTEWLDKTAKGRWYIKLGDFILKLPLRVAMNLLKLIYSIIKGALYGFIHPVKALQKFGDHVVNVANKLTQPVTWIKIGAGIIGGSVGSSLVTGNPIAVIGLGIGASLILTGVISGIITVAAKNEKGKRKEAVKKEIINYLKSIPMAFLTGFIVGVTVGGIMQVTTNMQDMEAVGAESSGMTTSLAATPPPPTLGLPPFLATHLHYEHPGSEKTDKKGGEDEKKKKI